MTLLVMLVGTLNIRLRHKLGNLQNKFQIVLGIKLLIINSKDKVLKEPND